MLNKIIKVTMPNGQVIEGELLRYSVNPLESNPDRIVIDIENEDFVVVLKPVIQKVFKYTKDGNVHYEAMALMVQHVEPK